MKLPVVLAAPGLIYLLCRRQGDAYRLLGAPARLRGANLEDVRYDTDVSQSQVLVFSEMWSHSAALTKFRRDDAQYLVSDHRPRMPRWYNTAGRNALLEQMLDQRGYLGAVPMAMLHPTDPAALVAVVSLEAPLLAEKKRRRHTSIVWRGTAGEPLQEWDKSLRS